MRKQTSRLAAARRGCGVAAIAWSGARDYLDDARKRSLQKGDVRAAQIQLRNAVRSDPQNAEAHFQLARVSLELGDPVAAEREAKAARDRGYDPRAVMPVLAQSYMAQRKFRDILDDFTVGNKDPLLDADMLVTRGYAQAALRNLDDAQASFAQARNLAPNATRPLLASARIAAGRNDLRRRPEGRRRGARDRAEIARDPGAEVAVAACPRRRGRCDAGGDCRRGGGARCTGARLERAALLIAAGKSDEAKQDVDFVLASIAEQCPGALFAGRPARARPRTTNRPTACSRRSRPPCRAFRAPISCRRSSSATCSSWSRPRTRRHAT